MAENNSKSADLKFHSPGIYKISVVGEIHQSLRERLHISDEEPIDDKKGISTITVSVSDQAGLSGILDTLYNFHLPILKVEHQKQKRD